LSRLQVKSPPAPKTRKKRDSGARLDSRTTRIERVNRQTMLEGVFGFKHFCWLLEAEGDPGTDTSYWFIAHSVVSSALHHDRYHAADHKRSRRFPSQRRSAGD